MAAGAVLRTAVPQDAWALAGCHVQCWREAYAHLVSQEYLAAIDVAGRAEMWERAISRGAAVHVADLEGEVVGLAVAGPGRDDDAGLPELELRLIYLLAAHHGSGLGQQLVEAAVGAEDAYLWVATDNPRARAFYSRNGFRPDGANRIEATFEDMAEVRLVRRTLDRATGSASRSG